MKRKLALGLLGVGALVVLLVAMQDVCILAWLNHDLTLSECPSGRIRQTGGLRADNLRRGDEGTIQVWLVAHYMLEGAATEDTAPVEDFEARITLVAADGAVTPIPAAKGWLRGDGPMTAQVTLPRELPDGEYRLRARLASSLGEETVELPLGLYAPARVHVLTDRPLYEAGNVVRFRAVLLRARDLQPIEGRPGVWIVTAPDGEVLLEEKAPSGPWGVVAGSFPLDAGAAEGGWSVRWVSGDAQDERSFIVEPFTLPRFRVEGSAEKPFYRRGDAPAVKGQVTYSSGAPVGGAVVEVTWTPQGAWPPPPDWLDRLPKRAQAGASGRFELKLPIVPDDLRGKYQLVARLSAIDPAGDRVEGAATVLLAEDPIDVQAVSELGDGLVEGFNNRLYLRVASADGQVFRRGKVRVRRAWAPADTPIEAPLDEDGVAALQVDPGPAVNVVIPAMPVRPAPPQPLVDLGGIGTLLASGGAADDEGDEEASLADTVAVERWLPALQRCASFADAEAEAGLAVTVAVRAGADGRVAAAVTAGTSQLETCTRQVIGGQRLAPGGDRLYTIELSYREPDLPSLDASFTAAVGSPPEELQAIVAEAMRSARDCLPREVAAAELPEAMIWRLQKGEAAVDVDWMRDPRGPAAGQASLACLKRQLGRLALPEKSESDAMGLASFSVSPAPSVQAAEARDTVMLGYELEVTAEIDGKSVGSTKLRLTPGSVPPLRLRATPVLADPGEGITVEAIRGPDYRGELPRELTLEHGRGKLEAKLDAASRTARFSLKEEIDGWCEITGGGGRALVYIKPKGDLQVEIASEQPRYAPGQLARLRLQTTIGGQGAQAAVGLVGVDATLAQLAPLPGADDLGRLRPVVEMSSPAFGALDAQALVLGRIRGANAAAATILRVGSFPRVPEKDSPVGGAAETPFDPTEELTDRFYLVLDELYDQVRRWEAEAPKDQKMHPATMAKLWGQALDAVKGRGEPVEDAYGRELRLGILPRDLVALTDPRGLIVDGTRLPEDVENWVEWVEREKP